MRGASIAAAVSFATLSAACASASGPSLDSAGVGSTDEAIIAGKASDASQNAVVLIAHKIDARSYDECSGTLLAPNLVLTARHCVAQTADSAEPCGSSVADVTGDHVPNTLYITAGNKRRADPFASDARGAKIFDDGSKTLCGHDLALILLDTPIANATIAQIRLDALPAAGESFTAVGWGVTTSSESPSTRQQRTNVTIDSVGALSDVVADDEFVVGESICHGDSGGPALASKTGAVVGVVSRGGNDQKADPNDPSVTCIGANNIYSGTAGFKDVILGALSEAGQDPWIEGGPDPRLAKLGEACGSNEECRSALCNVGSSGAGVCTVDCTSAACDQGFECTAVNGAKLCLAKAAGGANGASGSTGGCATAPASSGSPSAWIGIALAGLAVVSRRRRAKG